MTKPYRTMISLFAVLGALAAIDAALSALGVTSFLMGLRWLRVHLVTIGIFAEAAFGLLPGLVALRAGRPAPPPRRDRWLLLNVGLVTLLVGIPLVRAPMIGVGGTLVLLAAVWLAWDLWRIVPDASDAAAIGAVGRPFYLAALSFVIVGALVGTGLWLGWGPWLRIAVPKETHVHAVVWGFASFVLAGLLTDLQLPLTGRTAARPRWLTIAFWLQLAGALALLAAPWMGDANGLMIGGIILFAVATALLYAQRILPLRERGGPGAAHVLTAYIWILVPATALPFILLGSGKLPVTRVESVGPAILAYGWLLQTLIALLPPVFAYVERADASSADRPALGGRWGSWIGVNLCILALVASIALPAYEARLQGLAFGLLAAVLLGWVWELVRVESWRAPAVAAGVLFIVTAVGAAVDSAASTVDAAPLQGGAWVLKAPTVYRETDRIPVPEENQQGSFNISPTGASSSFSWSNSSTGRSGSMSTSHAWTPPPAVLQPGQTIEVSVSSTLAISGSGDGWNHDCDTYFWANPPSRRLASANLTGYAYNPGTKTGKVAYTVPSGPGTLQWFFGVSTSWNNGSSVTFDYEWHDVAPPTTATASATATARPSPTPTPVLDVMVGHVERTQVIQCMDITEGATNCADNAIPLVRRKPTLLRVYPLVDLVSGKVDGLTLDARVTVLDPPGLVLRPLHGPAVLTAAHTNGSRAVTLRPHLGGGTLDFDVPLDLIRRARVVLRVELDPDRRLTETDTRNNAEIVTLDFVPSPVLAVTYVPIRYRPPGQPGKLPDADRLARAAAWMKGTFPLAANALTYRRGKSIGFEQSLAPKAAQRALIARLNWLYAHPRVLNLGDSPDVLVGWLPKTGDTNVVGMSNPSWSASAGLDHVVWAQDYARGPETMAHEIAHNLGRRHPIHTKPDRTNACGAWDGGTDWPFPLDPTIREIGVAPVAAGWKALASGLHDVMSYCDDKGYGLAPWTYQRLYDRLASKAPPSEARADAADAGAAEPLIVASGTVFRTGRAGIDKILFIDGDPSAVEYGESGEYCVVQLDGADRTLEDVCFDVDFLDSEQEPVDAEDFFVVRRAAPGVRALEVRRLGQTLARRAASAHAPAVAITSPSAGDRWDGQRTIRWTASDADGEPLMFDVVYSPNGGLTWTHVDAGLVGNTYAFDTAELPGGDGALVRVYTSDGFLTTVATSAPFRVTEKSPRPVILAPARGAILRPGVTVRLSAGGDDLEDGQLPSDAFTWTSDRDGLLGVGDMVVTQLSAGNHWITLGAQDSGGVFAADVISVSVRAYTAYLPVSLRAARIDASDSPTGTPAPASATPRRTATRTSTPGASPTSTRTRTPTSRPPTPSPTATGGPAPSCRSWLVNPGFESGPADWWAFAGVEPADAANVVVEGAAAGIAPRSGQWLAMLGRNPNTPDEILAQPWPPTGPLLEPGRMISATLNMNFGILTDEVKDGVHDDWLTSVVFDQAGNSEGVPGAGYTEEVIDSDTWYTFAHPVDVTGLLTRRSGWESMAFGWYAENSVDDRSTFVLDNVRLIVCEHSAAPLTLLPPLSPARSRDEVLPAAAPRTDAALADPRQVRRLGPIVERVLHPERSR